MQLVEVWRGNKRKGLPLDGMPVAPADMHAHVLELVIMQLLVEQVLGLVFNYTPYQTYAYITTGTRALLVKQSALPLYLEVRSEK